MALQYCKPMSGCYHSPACDNCKAFPPMQDAERELHQLLQCMREEGVHQEVEDDWLLALAEAAGPGSQRRLSSSQQVPLLLQKACCVSTAHYALHLAEHFCRAVPCCQAAATAALAPVL